MNTYPEMNEKIVGLLRWAGDENPAAMYAADRIEELEHEVKRLQTRHTDIDNEVINSIKLLKAAQAEIAYLQAENEQMRQTLEWYGDLANYMDADPPDYNSRVAHDRGKKARRVLAGEE